MFIRVSQIIVVLTGILVFIETEQGVFNYVINSLLLLSSLLILFYHYTILTKRLSRGQLFPNSKWKKVKLFNKVFYFLNFKLFICGIILIILYTLPVIDKLSSIRIVFIILYCSYFIFIGSNISLQPPPTERRMPKD